MTGTPLHITNGDAAAGAIARALPGEVLPWRDVLHEGPVPAGPDDALREARAAFIAAQGWESAGTVRGFLEDRDATVTRARDRDVILWFEPDLYDQLQLIQAMDLLARAGHPLERLTMVAPADYLGPMDPDAARAMFERERAPASEPQLAQASAAWAAVRAPDPAALARLAAEADGALRFLPAALARLLEELPAAGSGVSRSERQVLRALADGPRTIAETFRACADMEDWAFCGDAVFLLQLHRLTSAPVPLVHCDPPLGRAAIARPFDDVAAMRALLQARCTLTDAAREVLAGRRDWLADAPIDRWVGGTHLRRGHVWRWDGGRVVRDDA